jgi:hypothetical protein
MREAIVFRRERDFRQWFEANLQRFGVERIILSQEVCPDYVLQMLDGRIARVEAELFDVNFRYHGHDPAKVDFVLACYARATEIDGVPVVAANQLWIWDNEPVPQLPPAGPLSNDELTVLRAIHSAGGSLALAALGNNDDLEGDQQIWIRFSPEAVVAIPRGRADESVMSVMTPDAKKFIKKYHHALIAAGLSRPTCEALRALRQRGLIQYRPLAFLAALMDGGLIDHPGWLPTEAYETSLAMSFHRDKIHTLFWDVG